MRLIGLCFQRGARDMRLATCETQPRYCSERIGSPVRRTESCKRGDQINTAIIRNRAGQRLALALVRKQAEAVTEPLYQASPPAARGSMASSLRPPPATAQTASPAATQRADIETLQRLYNERFVATPFAGLYQIDRPIPYSPRETAPILVTRDGEYSFNNGKLGAQHGDTGAPLSGSEWGALVLRADRRLPL